MSKRHQREIEELQDQIDGLKTTLERADRSCSAAIEQRDAAFEKARAVEQARVDKLWADGLIEVAELKRHLTGAEIEYHYDQSDFGPIADAFLRTRGVVSGDMKLGLRYYSGDDWVQRLLREVRGA